jgi:hypothetical protein
MQRHHVSLSAPDPDEVSLLELADRLLNRGVVVTGEAMISVAGVDLIYLGLNVVLSAAENLLPKRAETPDEPPAARDPGA